MVLVPTQEDTKRETVLTLTLVKTISFSNRKCNKITFLKKFTKSGLGK